jgi:hypothetical protein
MFCAYRSFVVAALIAILLWGCSSVDKRIQDADFLAKNANMQKSLIRTDGFYITAFSKLSERTKPVNVYIEGDGFAWASRDRLSVNPTPKNPLALKLATKDDSPNIIYIARPCQYTSFEIDKLCAPKFWSGSRFSKSVISSVNDAINSILNDENAKVNLIGYSGGAAVATTLAAKRDDVLSLRTVAGNLDHIAVNKYHNVDLLDDSLNPSDYINEIANLPQYHFSGEKDKIVPPFIATDFTNAVNGKNKCAQNDVISGATHHLGWQSNWEKLLKRKFSCAG